jgi:hypothetical protein
VVEVRGQLSAVGAGRDRFRVMGADGQRCRPDSETAQAGLGAAVSPGPRFIGHGSGEAGSWLVTVALPGQKLPWPMDGEVPMWQGWLVA